MFKGFTYKGWNVLAATGKSSDEVKNIFDFIRDGEYSAGQVLKDHHRSSVHRFSYKGKELVVKIPLEKNRRPWIRFTTLFRQGEAFRNLKGMELLASQNIPSTIPVMAAECRRFGMVTDSFIIYHFLEGSPCTGRKEYYPKVVDVLKTMHQKNILHGDSQIQNFLCSNQQIFVIDSNPSSAGLTHFDKAYEFAYLLKSAPGIDQYFGDILQSSWYKFASGYLRFDRRLAKFRRRLKRAAGFTVREG
jgi:heptose II phosphotransferase